MMRTKNLLAILPTTILGLSLLLTQMAFQAPEHAGKPTSGPILNDSMYSADSALLQALDKQAWSYYWRRKFDTSLLIANKMEELSGRLLTFREDTVIRTLYFSAVGRAYQAKYYLGRVEEGLKGMENTLVTAINYFKKPHEKVAQSYIGLGWIYQELGDFEKGLQYLRRALAIKLEVKDSLDLNISGQYQNVGEAYFLVGEYSKAVYSYQRALGILDHYPADQPGILVARTEVQYNLARIYFEMNDLVNCKKMLNRILVTDKKLDYFNFLIDKHWTALQIADTYLLAGMIAVEEGEVEKGKAYLRQAIEGIKKIVQIRYIFKMPEKKLPLFFDLNSLLFIKKYAGSNSFEFDYLIDKLQTNLYLYSGNENARLLSVWHLRFAEYNLPSGKYEAVLAHCDKVLSFYSNELPADDPYYVPVPESLPLSGHLLKALFLRSHAMYRLAKQSGDDHLRRRADRSFEATLVYLESILLRFDRGIGAVQAVKKLKSQIFEGVLNYYLERYQETKEEHYLDQAYRTLQKNRSISLLLASRKAKSRISAGHADLVRTENELNSKLGFLEQQISEEEIKGSKANGVILQNYYYDVSNIRKALDSVSIEIQKSYPDYYALQQKALRPQSLADIRHSLRKDQAALIDYFIGDSTLVIFGITPDGVQWHREAGVNFRSIQSRIRNFKDRLAAADPSTTAAFQREGFALYQQFLSPVLKATDVRRLIILPDGPLHELPFSILPAEAVDPATVPFRDIPFLFRHYTIRQEFAYGLAPEPPSHSGEERAYLGFAPAYSGGDIHWNSEEERTLFRSIFPDISREGLAPLRHNDEEVETGAALFRGEPLIAGAATEKRFKELAPRARILHLAMHALVNDQEPLYSQLLFAEDPADTTEDGRLHAYELYNLDLSAELAVLSACNTGAGRIQRGDGVMSLARAFRYAGVPNIVMSLWPANDASTQHIMTAFFQYLKEGQPKDEALRQAQLDFLNDPRNTEMTHPYYWAGFVLVGDGEPLGRRKPWWPYALIAAGGLTLVLLFALREKTT